MPVWHVFQSDHFLINCNLFFFDFESGNVTRFISDFAKNASWFTTLPAHLICNIFTTIVSELLKELGPDSSEKIFSLVSLKHDPVKLTLGHKDFGDFKKAELQHQLTYMLAAKCVVSAKSKQRLCELVNVRMNEFGVEDAIQVAGVGNASSHGRLAPARLTMGTNII